MFDKLKDMILSVWRAAEEQQLEDMFWDSYLDNIVFNKWRYNTSIISWLFTPETFAKEK
jgi:hypothetical protein